MKKSVKLRGLKLAASVLCVLAAGLCYSCGQKPEDTVLLLASQDAAPAEPETAESAERLPDETAAEPLPGTEPETADETEAEREAPAPEPTICYVHICGEVEAPGEYELEAGQRVFEAVELAGGFTEKAADGYLNMAMEIEDGMMIVVPSEDQMADMPPDPGVYRGGQPASESGGNQKVNINTAGAEELMTLTGIGEARAEDILRYRQEHGAFRSIEEIMNVSGIKDAAFQKIKDDITV